MSILIVGAGPVGLMMAGELARYGIATRIIDRAAQPTQTSKALVIWSRTLELLDRAGCTQDFLDAGVRAHGAAMHHGGKVLGRVKFDNISSPYNFALMIPQRDTERLLAAHVESLGLSIERQVELTAFSHTRELVQARLKHADGREEVFETPWLVACDGAHSTVRHGLGADFQGDTRGDDWYLADVRLEGADAPPGDEISIYFHRDGPFVVFPIPGGRARVIAMAGKSDPVNPRPDPNLAEVQELADERAGGAFKLVDPVWLAVFRINERKVSEYHRDRVFLAGDAAHIHSPAGGQGMNTGMQDAVNLAWKLAMVMNGDAGGGLLESYSPERSAVGDKVVRNAARLTDMATLVHPASQAARNLALHFLLGIHAVRDRLASTMSETDIEYANSVLCEGRNSGTRMAPKDYAGAAPGGAKDYRFVLFAGNQAKGTDLAARYSRLLQPQCRLPPDIEHLLIVRPDGYVGLSAGADDWKAAERYLERLAS